MSQPDSLKRLFISADSELTGEQARQADLYNMLLRSVLARCKHGHDWLDGIEYDTLMEHFVALQRTRVYREAVQDRERQLQALINHRLRGTEIASRRGHRVCREAVMVRSSRALSLDDTYTEYDEDSEASRLLARNQFHNEASPARLCGQKDEYRALEQAIASLKEREQQAVRLYMEGANYTQAGQALGVSDVYARRLLVGAFEKLRRLMGDSRT